MGYVDLWLYKRSFAGHRLYVFSHVFDQEFEPVDFAQRTTDHSFYESRDRAERALKDLEAGGNKAERVKRRLVPCPTG